jgi:hypothetical protein
MGRTRGTMILTGMESPMDRKLKTQAILVMQRMEVLPQVEFLSHLILETQVVVIRKNIVCHLSP